MGQVSAERTFKWRTLTLTPQELKREARTSRKAKTVDVPRPTCRSQCVDGPRPCPWVGCRYHLYVEVLSRGSLKLNWPNHESWELPQTCSLDVANAAAETDGLSLEGVGRLLQLTRERVRQIEVEAIEHARESGVLEGVDVDEREMQ